MLLLPCLLLVVSLSLCSLAYNVLRCVQLRFLSDLDPSSPLLSCHVLSPCMLPSALLTLLAGHWV